MSFWPYEKLEKYGLARDNGASIDDVNRVAKTEGISVIQRIWILNQLFELSIDDSKEYVITREEGGLEWHVELIKSIELASDDLARESNS